MWYKAEINSLYDFPFWSGGKDTFDDIVAAGKVDELDDLYNTVFGEEEAPTDAAINDWLWFERDDIYRELGLDENGKLPPTEKEVEITWDADDVTEGYIDDDFEIRAKISDELYDIKKDYPSDYGYVEISRNTDASGNVIVKYRVTDIEW